jgi:hypothetical protein
MTMTSRVGRFATMMTVAALVVAAPALSAAPSDGGAPGAEVYVVQAMPGATYDVAIDGQSVESDVAEGKVLGPYDLDPGSHTVVFTPNGNGTAIRTSVSVKGGASTDVVLHRPAAAGGDPVLSVYTPELKPIGPGKARVLVAHTATVPPADVRVDGQVVFQNIANGEYAEADVPAGEHRVALLPSGQQTDPLLGPIDVDLPAGTVTLVYAVGSPANGSMNVIAHRERLDPDGSAQPSRIETGSAGLLAHRRVHGFGG